MTRKLYVISEEDPLTSFFLIELTKGLNLIKKIHSDLSLLAKILRGAQTTSDILLLATELMRLKSPNCWIEIWQGPESPAMFMKQAILNTLFISDCREKNISSTFLQFPINLSRFFNPGTFLNAFRQQTSRKISKPIDSLQLTSSWIPDTSIMQCQISSLLLQGCRFDGKTLTDVESDDKVFCQVPVCYLSWTVKTDVKVKVEIPLYKSLDRECLIAGLQVPCTDDGSKWCLAGAAFFLDCE